MVCSPSLATSLTSPRNERFPTTIEADENSRRTLDRSHLHTFQQYFALTVRIRHKSILGALLEYLQSRLAKGPKYWGVPESHAPGPESIVAKLKDDDSGNDNSESLFAAYLSPPECSNKNPTK
eukprot:c18422_g1_i5.p2 GENE.c18422_g1_i5~~c18422_g1_i5.p2  ORF type:complete len:123 (-),score=26.05 c18422_g1_i5:6-374(-)